MPYICFQGMRGYCAIKVELKPTFDNSPICKTLKMQASCSMRSAMNDSKQCPARYSNVCSIPRACGRASRFCSFPGRSRSSRTCSAQSRGMDESRSNSENHRWAIQRRFERGEYKLGNNQILGYDADENGKPVPNGDAWIVQRIFQLFADGSTVWEIAEILEQEGAHCLRSEKSLPVKQINYILRNEVYVGDRKLQKKNPKNYLTKKPDANIEKRSYYLKDIHEGIVDRTLWERVQAQLDKAEAARMEERDAGILRKRRSGHFLTGMLFCEKCGTVYCRRTFQKKGQDGEKISYHAWKCKERMKKGINPCGRSASPRCSSPIVREEELLQEIANQLAAKGIAIPAQSRDAGMAEIVKRYARKILIGESGITVKIPEERVA